MNDLFSRYIDKYAIIRSSNEGVNAGYVVAASGEGVVLREARRLWYHRPENNRESWYEGVANHGLSADSKISAPVIEKAIIESYSITLCTEKAEQSIKNMVTYAQ